MPQNSRKTLNFMLYLRAQVWSGNLGKPVTKFGNEELGPAMSVAISHQRATLAVGYHSGEVRTYDVLTGKSFISLCCLIKKFLRAAPKYI